MIPITYNGFVHGREDIIDSLSMSQTDSEQLAIKLLMRLNSQYVSLIDW